MAKQFILKFEQCDEQRYGYVCRIVGFISGRSILPLLDNAELSANPRAAKTGSVTSEIMNSLNSGPELFPFKTKGILAASTKYKALERSRYEITFSDPEIEGILDGGHNTLAVGLFILNWAGVNVKPIKSWDQFMSAWSDNRKSVEGIKQELDFLVPLELLIPSDMQNPECVDQFSSSLVDICEARNNNVSLTDETQANKRGFYEELKEFLPPEISQNVEWRSNSGGRIKPREIVALTWIPLSVLKLPNGYRVNPNQIYRNKGVCVETFSKMMEDPAVSSKVEGTGSFKLNHIGIKSALKTLEFLPKVYDYIYENLPEAYNKAGGSFGKISAVKMYDASKANESKGKYLKEQPVTPFFEIPVKNTCPDGFIVPLIYGLRALLKEKDGEIFWRVDPTVFLQQNLGKIMKSYRLAIEMAQWDPQKVGKNIHSYEFAEATIRNFISAK